MGWVVPPNGALFMYARTGFWLVRRARVWGERRPGKGVSAGMSTIKELGRNGTEVVQPRLRVLVVDDDPLVRRMIREALRPADILVVGEAHNGRDALRAGRYYKPDIILLDVVLPGIDGITVLEQMVADERIDAKIVVLSVRGEGDLGYLALRKGADGYLNKELDLSVLPRVLRDVAEGGAAVSRTLAADLARRIRELPDAPLGMRPVRSVLTTREWEVVDQLCAGSSTSEIAAALVLSTETVRTHVKNIMRKLKVHSRAEVVEAAGRLRAGDFVPQLGDETDAAPLADETHAALEDGSKLPVPVH
jgi:NarL family two-component system response regulator LiaR